jgi:aconitate hydratase
MATGHPDSFGAPGVAFDARVRIDTPNEWRYSRHGGILRYVLRQLRDKR